MRFPVWPILLFVTWCASSVSPVRALETEHLFAPIRIAPSAKTRKDLLATNHAWAERTLLKPMAARTEGQPWQKAALEFAGQAVDDLLPSSDRAAAPVLLEEALRVEAAGCRDPLFLYLLGRQKVLNTNPDRHERISYFVPAFEAAQQLPGPKTLSWLLQRELCLVSGVDAKSDQPKVVQAVVLLNEVMTDGSFQPDEDQLFYRYFVNQHGARFDCWPQWFLALTNSAPLGEWVQKLILARLETRLYENGFGQEKWTHVRQLLFEAWELRPDRSDAASQLITLDGQDVSWAEGRSWFDRATAVEFDAEEAYTRMYDLSLPRSRGSIAQTIAFGEACLATQRFETVVPRFFSLALRGAALAAPDWREIYRRPDLAAEQIALGRALLAEPSRRSSRRDNLESQAINAYLAGDLALAVATRRDLPGALSPAALEKLDELGIHDFEQQMAALQTPAAEALTRAEAARRDGQPEETYAALSEAEKTATPAAKASLAPGVARAAFQAAFARGEWVSSPLDDQNPAWKGGPSATSKSIAFKPARQSRIIHAFPVGESFELRADLPTGESRPGRLLSDLFVARRPRSDGPVYPIATEIIRVELRARQDGVIAAALTDRGGQHLLPARDLPGRPINTVLLRWQEGFVTVEVNGVVLTEDFPRAFFLDPSQDTVFGFDREPQTAAAPSKIEVRQLKDEEARPKSVQLDHAIPPLYRITTGVVVWLGMDGGRYSLARFRSLRSEDRGFS